MNILMINFPAEGHVNPTIGMVKAFTDRGDEVHYITTEKYKERLEGVGANVHLHNDWLRTITPDLYTFEGMNTFLKVHIQTSLETLAITKNLKELYTFDLVFFDNFGAGELVRDYLDIPGISSSSSFLMPDMALKELPFHPQSEASFEPDQEAKTQLHNIEKTYGVKPKSLAQFMMNRGECQIVYTSRYFQPYSEHFGDHNIFIGPSFPDRKGAHDFPVEQLVDELVLYISMGTVLSDQEAFINACIDAFANFDGKVVISTGNYTDESKLKSAPDHFLIASYVPQLEVLQKANVFITHGGMNSVNEAIHHNVPMVVVPHDKDQPMVAQRLEELGAGYPISKDSITTATLQGAVQEVINDEQYKQNIEKINQSFKESGGVEKALREIDAFLGK
ncbi:macrolide family glycosyltransferase [Pontibacillus yanchengensis]|uniref:UDP-glucosyltransferase n=1 Tax=Pontibacillus yanchengensis Y32 TaxID=1385514 RepID=A0A0A2TCI4_9BACI|nr:macrolide family glycosyltransferase [Pontibacillus yanchengensis]KGP73249.1 UDP-glucosyltransferase [Pontibacillus yanchengensis Y32]